MSAEEADSGFLNGRGVGRRNEAGVDKEGRMLDCRDEFCEPKESREDEADDREETEENMDDPDADDTDVEVDVCEA